VSAREAIASHDTSIAVWDLATPVVSGRRATLKVGVACSAGCNLTGARIDVYNDTGARVGGGALGPARWPGASALYWTEFEVAAPDAEGEHSWTLQATVAQPSHAPAISSVRVIAVRPPEHRVTLAVTDKDSDMPVAGIELRIGVFRAATNEAGVAHLEVPAGTYDVAAWKIGYDLLSAVAHVTADTTIRLEVAAVPEPEQPYWM
jgi:hypothetical protein